MSPISHVFTSPKADGADTSLVRPSNWNSGHAYTLQEAVSLEGNTAGVMALISSGTLVLAGGNNITLSQAGNAVTISGGAGGGAGISAGLSTLGNTAGDTALVTGRLVLAGGDNITLSGSTNGGSMTVTISGAAGGGGAVVSNALQDVSTATGSGTNTSRFAADDHVHRGVRAIQLSGVASSFYGNFVFVTGNNISLATGGASTAGSLQIVNMLSSGGNILGVHSINAAGADASKFALEEHRHAGLNSISVAGNTAGNSSAGAGSLILAGGSNITLSGATAAGGMTLSVSGNAPDSIGISTMGNTAGDTGLVTGRFVLVGGSNVTLSGATGGNSSMTITVSAGGQLSHYAPNTQRADAGIISNASMSFAPLQLPEMIVASRINLFVSLSGATASSGGVSISFGIYTRTGSTLSRYSSGSQSYSWTSNTIAAGDWGGYFGPKLWSVPLNLTLTPGNYWMGYWHRTTNAGTHSMLGQATGVFSGFAGVVSNASQQYSVGMGYYSVSYSSAMQDSVALSDLIGSGAGNRVWHAQFVNIP